VYVCDRENNRVQVFTVDGDYITEWGDFYHPMRVFMDGHGIFYVTDQIPRITMLNSEGELVTRGRTPFGGHGMWVDSKGNIYLASNAEGITKLVKQ
jgi:DNA-binding beta-propeller fold protein YncE